MVPANYHPTAVLSVLKRGGSLKSIYLNVLSSDILEYLNEHCPNLETISFLPRCSRPSSTLVARYDWYNDVGALLKTIKVCKIAQNITHIDAWYLVICFFSEKTNLRRLTLNGILMTSRCIVSLSNLWELTDLSFLYIRLEQLIYENQWRTEGWYHYLNWQI